jgi:hypothetical protein
MHPEEEGIYDHMSGWYETICLKAVGEEVL